jgi:hypothetical protein
LADLARALAAYDFELGDAIVLKFGTMEESEATSMSAIICKACAYAAGADASSKDKALIRSLLSKTLDLITSLRGMSIRSLARLLKHVCDSEASQEELDLIQGFASCPGKVLQDRLAFDLVGMSFDAVVLANESLHEYSRLASCAMLLVQQFTILTGEKRVQEVCPGVGRLCQKILALTGEDSDCVKELVPLLKKRFECSLDTSRIFADKLALARDEIRALYERRDSPSKDDVQPVVNDDFIHELQSLAVIVDMPLLDATTLSFVVPSTTILRQPTTCKMVTEVTAGLFCAASMLQGASSDALDTYCRWAQTDLSVSVALKTYLLTASKDIVSVVNKYTTSVSENIQALTQKVSHRTIEHEHTMRAC